ncbi:hypothetical protein ACFPRL_18505 [Pseudoclavibacter helvolus]|uniref:Uncharacterized protein n=1 Tax=Pseudoclavibacter helvolus TaxID=255205 RepID=A0A7W4YFV8_9MICO|nr:hypothetical protein [Pseudoclavibacter helvolus]MBB2958038.1 hypothetical protein [Pseudoclavibacter helvolus]
MSHESLTPERIDDTTEILVTNALIKHADDAVARARSLNLIKSLRKTSWQERRSTVDVGRANSQLAIAAAHETLRAEGASLIADATDAGPRSFSAVGVKNYGTQLIAVDAIAASLGWTRAAES